MACFSAVFSAQPIDPALLAATEKYFFRTSETLYEIFTAEPPAASDRLHSGFDEPSRGGLL